MTVRAHESPEARGRRSSDRWEVRIHEAVKKELLDLSEDDFERVDAHLEMLADDPLRPRPRMDILKLKDIEDGGLYRLRIGEHRALYAAIYAHRRVDVLVIEDREVGHTRLIARATARLHD